MFNGDVHVHREDVALDAVGLAVVHELDDPGLVFGIAHAAPDRGGDDHHVPAGLHAALLEAGDRAEVLRSPLFLPRLLSVPREIAQDFDGGAVGGQPGDQLLGPAIHAEEDQPLGDDIPAPEEAPQAPARDADRGEGKAGDGPGHQQHLPGDERKLLAVDEGHHHQDQAGVEAAGEEPLDPGVDRLPCVQLHLILAVTPEENDPEPGEEDGGLDVWEEAVRLQVLDHQQLDIKAQVVREDHAAEDQNSVHQEEDPLPVAPDEGQGFEQSWSG